MKLLRWLGLVATLVAVMPAFAQFGGSFGRGGMRGPGGAGGPQPSRSGNERNDFALRPAPGERLQLQLDALREDLKLSLVQEKEIGRAHV